ncbi:putative leucine-rich repeat domain superfamily, F-box-like domain superfamily [Dioscorea sansibarensis]
MHEHNRRHRLRSWPELWFADAPLKPPLKHVVLDMHLPEKQQTLTLGPDLTAPLSDELLLRLLSALPDSALPAASLVCKRWLRLLDRLRRRLILLDWSCLPRIPARFPELSDLDLLPASFFPSSPSPLILTRDTVSIPLDPYLDPPIGESPFISSAALDSGLRTLAQGCPNLRRLSLVAPPASEAGLMSLAERCTTLQELELHRCTDVALRPISAFTNLQILKLVGSIEGLYRGPGVTDVGLTILAHGCKRLVKLELARCEGSYDGISAVGRCCFMLEELTLTDHRMDAGWLAGLSFCGNLKTLRLQGCRSIDADPGPAEHLGTCPAIERLQLQRCQLRDKRSLSALYMVCEAVREIMFQNCWGLDNDLFGIASICRRVKFLCLEGCSLLTTEGLESVVLSWNDLQSLAVVSCNNIKDEVVSPAMSSLFSVLKDLKWRPDSKSVLATSLAGTGMGKKGGRFFKRT